MAGAERAGLVSGPATQIGEKEKMDIACKLTVKAIAKTNERFLKLLGLGALFFVVGACAEKTNLGMRNAEAVAIANPASTHCAKVGGQLVIEKDTDGGEYGVCLFESGRACEEWALFRGECPVGGVEPQDTNLAQIHFTALCVLMNKRLALSKDVAAYKYTHGLAVEDKGREAVVIASSLKKAAAAGLSSETVRPFFDLQIELSKQVQRGYIQSWRENGFPEYYPLKDLQTELRPEFIDVGGKIIASLKTVANDNGEAGQRAEIIDRVINADFVSDVDRAAMLKSISAIQHEQ
jgi:chorismate mutase-like protein